MFAPLSSLRPLARPLFVASAGGGGLPVTANLVAWWKGDDYTPGNWPDASSNGHTGTQSTSGQQPSPGPTLNGHATLQFDGSNDVLGLGDLSAASTACSVFVVLKWTGNYGIWQMAGTADDGNSYYDLGGTTYEAVGSTIRKSFPIGTASAWHIYEIIASGSAWDAYKNGSSLYSAGSNTFSPLRSAAVLGFNSAFYGQFAVAELIIFADAKNSTDRAAVESYLQTKYAL